jgi:gluconokinase
MSVFVLMGVSGAGKSTVGRRVAAELGLTFIEGDDFHPPANVQKMAGGTPLTDQDRVPWIEALAQGINARQPLRDAIVACSALSKVVRDLLHARVMQPLHFILLHADPAIIEERLARRPLHFMKPGMLASQLAALQSPDDAIVVDVSRPLAIVCADVAARIRAIIAAG